MTFRVVIDTNIWIRILLKGRVTLPILEAFNEDKFQLVMSQVASNCRYCKRSGRLSLECP